MKVYTYFVLFTIDSDKFAIPYERVIEATKSAEITPLPYPTKRILGIVNFHGRITPVVNLRKLMKRDDKELDISDNFIILKTSDNSFVALIADSVQELIRPNTSEITDIKEILLDYELYEGTIKMSGALVPIINVDNLLSKNEKSKLEATIA
ncbi:MAG: chemotaxis protein CheW [Lentisphaerota bacterium]